MTYSKIILGQSSIFTSIEVKVAGKKDTTYYVEFPDLMGQQRYFVGTDKLTIETKAEGQLFELLYNKIN